MRISRKIINFTCANMIWMMLPQAWAKDATQRHQLRCFLEKPYIRFVLDGKTQTQKSSFCVSSEVYEILSYNCVTEPNCMALMRYQQSSIQAPANYNALTNPYYQKCKDLGGETQMIEFYDEKKWNETGLCRFKDGSFISVFNKVY